MSCTQKQQLVCFPKVRVYKPWFRHFNDHKDFRNEGTVHLFSLMALFSYANFRSNERVINGDRYMEAPGQWICKLGALPRILRVHSKTQALELMEYFQNHGFLTFEILDEEKEILRFTIADWKEHCTHLQYRLNEHARRSRAECHVDDPLHEPCGLVGGHGPICGQVIAGQSNRNGKTDKGFSFDFHQ